MKNVTSMEQFTVPNIEAEVIRRRDMRNVFTFTIDPKDAKDFDDALSFNVEEDGTFQVGVHIADVTFYVQPDTDLDKSAYQKATSIYYVDHVLPMLPEELCNDLCSLRPNEDKLTMSVIFTIDPESCNSNMPLRILKHKICRTVIRSNFRLAYEEAQNILDTDLQITAKRRQKDGKKTAKGADPNEMLAEALHTLNEMAIQLRRERMKNGALDIEQEELQFELDENKHPVKIIFHKPTAANHLIEEFMLLANRTIATEMGKRGHEFVYRVHDKPDHEKLEQVCTFQKRFGDTIPASVIEMLTIRAMAKAVYDTKNIGHYGLAFDYYTHFTSPIRRYPDMMVHRLVSKFILGERTRGAVAPQDLKEACLHCSEMEQFAQQEERDSVKQMQTIWMADHLGEEFDGTIVNVTDFGLFIRLDDNCCEGLIHITDLVKDDYMLYDSKNFRLIGERTGKTFTIGDRLHVKLTRADIDKKQIDFELVTP